VDLFDRIELAIRFIEEHILDELTLEGIAAQAFFSPYHFHRIFRALAGESVGEYIRKRRMALAAEQLLAGSRSILDIALDYHFQSHEAFTRSFKKALGYTPAEYRRKGMELTTLLKKRLDGERLRHLKEGVTMEPKIVQKRSFDVVGMEITTTHRNNWKNMDIAKLWIRFNERVGEIADRVDADVSYGICGDVTDETSISCEMTQDTEYGELVSVEVSQIDRVPSGMIGRTVPGRTYAVFTHKGPLFPNYLQQTYDYIYGTWLPRSGRELDGGWDFERYDERFTGVDDPDSEFGIYVPIKA
jgi:AraC family transcriptional regulator